MNNRPTLNPYRIPNNFRLQTNIDDELLKANQLEKKLNKNYTPELIKIALVFLEGGQVDNAEKYALMGLNKEKERGRRAINYPIGTAHYILATCKREKNQCEEAIAEYQQAMFYSSTDSWLISNIFRNLGLAYLKQQDFLTAAEKFKEGINCIEKHKDEDIDNTYSSFSNLKGSLPALYNYYALALTREGVKSKNDLLLKEGLETFKKTTELYSEIFKEKKISELDQLKSHDWQSHQFHRGMILCEIEESEQKPDQEKFQQAEKLLLGALEGRKANQADAQRLGDVCVWLGRAYIGLSQAQKAKEYFENALNHYQKAFPLVIENAPEAQQIVEVRGRLELLKKKESPLVSHGLYSSSSSSSSSASSSTSSAEPEKISSTQNKP